MALINCPECTKQISDQSNSCPHCGYPMKPQKLNQQPPPLFYDQQPPPLFDGQQKKEKKSKSYGCGTFLLILFVGFILYQCQTSYSDYQERTQQNSAPTSASSSSKGSIPSQFVDIAENFDDEPMLDPDVTRDDFLLGLSAIRMQRNTCDTISSVALMYGGGIRFTCNNFSLKYEVTKENGKFVVK
ncbi:zinc ribbon domain-containing protein [Acinetobacter johnsonii]|uniref:Zinc ribbon domain-containing protein n=1 Tax=Acinetobacter johnsonii TaxID=40214 RepID=A0AA42IME4_ACIJO|nr:zinc ribbon domain-containing protein [Acinetobacter johnsonii]MDH0657766.1 zinc ribbon domain-containing protein [Acinetobacter johnsonii]